MWWSDAGGWPFTSQGLTQKRSFPPSFPRGNRPWLLTLDLWFPPSTTVSPYNAGWLSHPSCGVCYGSPSQPIQWVRGFHLGWWKVWIWLEVVVVQRGECTRCCWIDFKTVNSVLSDFHLVERERCCHYSKQRIFACHHAISHCSLLTPTHNKPQCWALSRIQDGEKQVTVCALDTGPDAYLRKHFREPRLMHVPIHEKKKKKQALKSLPWDVWCFLFFFVFFFCD